MNELKRKLKVKMELVSDKKDMIKKYKLYSILQNDLYEMYLEINDKGECWFTAYVYFNQSGYVIENINTITDYLEKEDITLYGIKDDKCIVLCSYKINGNENEKVLSEYTRLTNLLNGLISYINNKNQKDEKRI